MLPNQAGHRPHKTDVIDALHRRREHDRPGAHRRSPSPPALSAHAVGPAAHPGAAHESYQADRSALPGNDAAPFPVLILNVVQQAGVPAALRLVQPVENLVQPVGVGSTATPTAARCGVACTSTGKPSTVPPGPAGAPRCCCPPAPTTAPSPRNMRSRPRPPPDSPAELGRQVRSDRDVRTAAARSPGELSPSLLFTGTPNASRLPQTDTVDQTAAEARQPLPVLDPDGEYKQGRRQPPANAA